MGTGIRTIDQIQTLHPTSRLTMSLSLLLERQEPQDLAEIGLLLHNGADMDQVLTDLPKRTPSTSLDAVQALLINLHFVGGNRAPLADCTPGTIWCARSATTSHGAGMNKPPFSEYIMLDRVVTEDQDPFADVRWDGESDPYILLRRTVMMGTWDQIKQVAELPLVWSAIIASRHTWMPLTTRQACLMAHLAGLTREHTEEKLLLCRGDSPAAKEMNGRLCERIGVS